MIPQSFFTKLKLFCDDHKLDSVHGYDHFLAVYNHSIYAICDMLKYKSITDNDIKAILYASLLHDVDDRKLFPKNINHENARKLLVGVPNEIIYFTLTMISLVSCSTNGNSQKGVLFDWMLIPRISDRLEAIGQIGIKRALDYGKSINRPMHNAMLTRRATTEPILWGIATDQRFKNYQNGTICDDTTLGHFYDKLLHIGKVEKWGINNDYLVNVGLQRHQEVITFVLQYWKDIENKEPNPKYVAYN
jgi:uncharacterized protein